MAAETPNSYKDPYWSDLAGTVESKLGIPQGLLVSVLTKGERSNADQVSEANAKTVFQITPATRNLVLKRDGIDAYLSPENAAEVAGLVLKDGLKWAKGRTEDPSDQARLAAGYYHAGGDTANWGRRTMAYMDRVAPKTAAPAPPVQSVPQVSTFDRVKSQMAAALPQSTIASVYDAYSSGQMTPQESAAFEKDVRDGAIMLPRGASLKGEGGATGGTAGPMVLPAQVVDAYAKGQMSPQERTQLEHDMRAGLVTMPAGGVLGNTSAVAQIPGATSAPVAPQPQPGPEPSLAQKIVGAGEVGLSTATGMTGGTLGMIGGTLKGLAEQILSGQFGTPQAADLVERSASEGQRALTYEPRTPVGQSMAETAGGLMQNLVPIGAVAPTMPPIVTAPGKVPAGVLARAGAEGVARDIGGARAAAAVGAVGDTAARMADVIKSGATTLPRRALQAVQESLAPSAPPVGAAAANDSAMAGVGAAATSRAAQRVATAEQLGFTGDKALTVGQATRDPAQLKFEIEQAKNPESGGLLRERIQNQNEHVLGSFDQWVDQTGAEAPNLRAVGKVVDEALVKQAAKDKTELNVAGAIARRSPEARAIVDQMRDVAIGEGDNAIISTPLKYLNDQPTGLPSTKVPDAAKQYAVRIGIAEMRDGELVPNPNATVAQLEKWRQEINGATGYERADIRHATILKALIDGQTEPLAGPLFQRLRSLRTRYAQNYENIGAIDKLMSLKPGTTDRQVAFEDVWKHSILDGSLDDTRQVRRVLQRAGPDGHQAWRELQGQTMRWVQEQAFGNSATDARGNRVLSPPKLDKAIRTLDADGKLEFIFGKRGAQTLRDINDIAKEIKTAPPESAINMSNTATTLLTSSADVALGIFTGIPAPLATAARAGIKYIKDNALRRRIAESLDGLRAQRPASSLPPAPPPRGNVAPPAPPAPQGATVH